MPRPKKAQDEKKDRRLTVYLSEAEHAALKDVSDQQQRSMTQIVTDALRSWLLQLLEPPESLRQARNEKIMKEKSLTVRGYVCPKGHAWWIDWVEPTPPRRCPMCGTEQELRSTWGGTVKRGL